MTTTAAAKMGLDDFIVATWPDHKRALRELIDNAVDPEPVDVGSLKLPGKDLDPAEEAVDMLQHEMLDGVSRLRCYRDAFLRWQAGRYEKISDGDLRSKVVRVLNERYFKLGGQHINNVIDQIACQSRLPESNEAPCWLTAPDDDMTLPDWDARDVLATRNCLLHLPSLGTANNAVEPATPRFFTHAATEFEFDPSPPAPAKWFEFLDQLWPDDADCIELLQCWFGYGLTSDTRQQKALLLIGPKRSGKGTIARVQTAIVGAKNVASPTLGSLAGPFGLENLLGKSLAIIGDARLSRRTDQAAVTERLLSIIGEDQQDVARKHRTTVTVRLPVRFMLITNELPSFNDPSGALAGRFLILRTVKSFFDAEDHGLEKALLEERAGILAWAIEGWRKLRAAGRFREPEAAAGYRDDFEGLASPISKFLGECCELGKGFEVRRDSLFNAWLDWCGKGNLEAGSDVTFGKNLRTVLPDLGDGQRNCPEGKKRIYRGLRLRGME